MFSVSIWVSGLPSRDAVAYLYQTNLHRGIALPEYERRPRAAIFQRRNNRGHHHGAGPLPANAVLARNSSFRFRGGDLDMVRVGRELGVQYLVEGSVRLMGNRVRISAQLIDAADGKHVWADRYDRSREEIFDCPGPTRANNRRDAGRANARSWFPIARRKAPASLAAYECVLRAALVISTSGGTRRGASLYEKAVALDPNYARAYALLALCHSSDWETDLATPNSLLDQASISRENQ